MAPVAVGETNRISKLISDANCEPVCDLNSGDRFAPTGPSPLVTVVSVPRSSEFVSNVKSSYRLQSQSAELYIQDTFCAGRCDLTTRWIYCGKRGARPLVIEPSPCTMHHGCPAALSRFFDAMAKREGLFSSSCCSRVRLACPRLAAAHTPSPTLRVSRRPSAAAHRLSLTHCHAHSHLTVILTHCPTCTSSCCVWHLRHFLRAASHPQLFARP